MNFGDIFQVLPSFSKFFQIFKFCQSRLCLLVSSFYRYSFPNNSFFANPGYTFFVNLGYSLFCQSRRYLANPGCFLPIPAVFCQSRLFFANPGYVCNGRATGYVCQPDCICIGVDELSVDLSCLKKIKIKNKNAPRLLFANPGYVCNGCVHQLCVST